MRSLEYSQQVRAVKVIASMHMMIESCWHDRRASVTRTLSFDQASTRSNLLASILVEMDRTKPSPSMFTPGAVAMVGLRLADPLIQFTLLRDGHAASFMQSILRMPQAYTLAPAVLAVPGISSFSIGGLNEVASAIVAMYGVAGLRHVSILNPLVKTFSVISLQSLIY